MRQGIRSRLLIRCEMPSWIDSVCLKDVFKAICLLEDEEVVDMEEGNACAFDRSLLKEWKQKFSAHHDSGVAILMKD